MKKWIFLLLCLTSLEAGELKKYNLSVCAVFKNEAPYLKEWIEYHKLVGVDHFYLYSNLSSDSFRKVLSPYIKNKMVTLIQWPDHLGPMADSGDIWSLSTQVTAYENAIKWKALNETKWLIILDVDEYLVPCSKGKVGEILDQYDEFPGITLTSEFFDASKRSALPPRKLVIEAIEITAPPEKIIQRTVEKTILKPDLCTSFIWPPYKCKFKDHRNALKVNKEELRINSYQNRMRFQKLDRIKRKVQINKDLPEEEKNKLLKSGYEIEDPDKAIYRFVPDLYKKMGLDVGGGR